MKKRKKTNLLYCINYKKIVFLLLLAGLMTQCSKKQIKSTLTHKNSIEGSLLLKERISTKTAIAFLKKEYPA